MRLNIALAILVLFSSVSSFAAGSRDEDKGIIKFFIGGVE